MDLLATSLLLAGSGSLLSLPSPFPRERRAFLRYLAPLRRAKWVVYAKPPFAGPEQVLEYVGRYTHRVAISNNRLLDIDDGTVRFGRKDYRDGNRQKVMTVSADEFIRRFLLHTLSNAFIVSAIAAFSAIAMVPQARSLS